MATLDIVHYPHSVLKEPGHDVDEVDDDLRTFIDDLTETMYAANGAGLAAQQVGDTRRVCVIDTREEGDNGEKGRLYQLVNPRIVHREGQIKWEEGCLSFPDLYEWINRAAEVRVEALDRDGNPIVVEGEGLLGVALQHEIDHLDGVVFIDRMSRLKRRMAMKRYRKTLEELEAKKQAAIEETA